MKALDLNSTIKVKLTEKGKDIYYHQFDEVNKKISANGGKLITPRMPRVDENGYTSFQLHDFMHLYGPHMILGAADMGIDKITIFIDEKDLHDVQEDAVDVNV